MAIQQIVRWGVPTEFSPNIEAFADRSRVVVQQGEQRIECSKEEAEDLIAAIRAAADVAAPSDEDLPF